MESIFFYPIGKSFQILKILLMSYNTILLVKFMYVKNLRQITAMNVQIRYLKESSIAAFNFFV